MEVGYLGPLEVRDAGRAVAVPGSRLRRLLLRLALDPGGWVPAGALAEAVWGAESPADPANSLQSLVSRLRRALGRPELVEQSVAGYRLAVDPEGVDGVRFARLVAEGSRAVAAGDDAAAGPALSAALELWRGQPLDGDDTPEAAARRAALEDLRVQALADRAGVAVRAGRAADVLPGLRELATAHPLREDLATTLVDALVAAGRPAEALSAYERTRAMLADTLGADPSPALRQRHLEVLRLADRAAAPPTNLRASLTSFVGRDDDLRAVRGRLRTARLVTVVGAGGAGKTRLAGEVAAAVAAEDPAAVPDGVWWVELAPVTEPGAVAQALLDGLAQREVALPDQRAERPRTHGRSRLLEVLADARCLLVVDNCEHLVDAVADLLDEVLGRCPGVRVLATSREPLGIDGEVLHGLGPLPVPAEGTPPGGAAANPAVRLLLDRARAVDAGVVPDEHVVEIVRRLDGLPLAIELAAARLRALSTAEVAGRLADRFRLLTGGRRTAAPRHRTLRAVVEWSWDLLSPAEREVAEHVAVFPAGATEQAVAAVLTTRPGAVPAGPLADVLHALVDKSILGAERTAGGTRYRMLETLREYGTERLAERGLLADARAALARWAADLAAANDLLLRGPEQLAALRTFDEERENLLAALRSLGEAGDTAAALDLAVSLGWFWMLRENSEEAGRWLSFALGLPGADAVPAAVLAEAMLSAVDFGPGSAATPERSERFALLAGRLAAAGLDHPAVSVLGPLLLLMAERRAEGRVALDTALAHRDPWVRAAARLVELAYAENAGDVDALRAGVSDGIEQWRAVGDRWGLAAMLTSRGELRTMDGDLVGAAEDLEEAIETVRHLGGTADHVVVLMRLADLRLRAGDPAAARRHLETMRAQRAFGSGELLRGVLVAVTAVGIAVSEGDETELRRVYDEVVALLDRTGEDTAFSAHGGAIGHGAAGAAAVRLGDPGAAAAHLRVAYERAAQSRDRPLVAMVGMYVAMWLQATGDPAGAATALGAARVLRGTDDPTNPLVRGLTGQLRDELGTAFDERYAAGLALDPAAAEAALDPAHADAVPTPTT